MDSLGQPPCIHGCQGWAPAVRWEQVAPFDGYDGSRPVPVPQSILVYTTQCDHTGIWQPLDGMDYQAKQAALSLYYEPTLI